MVLSLLTLYLITDLKISNQGLVGITRFEIVPLFGDL